jgi:DNA-binding response OmpR family regulator
MDMERAGTAAEPRRGQVIQSQVITVGALSVDVGRLEADLGRGRVPLTRLEFLFLQELIRHPGCAVSKGQLLASVWGYESDPGSNVVGVCVRRLRTKLGDQLIKTVRGEGYQLGVG